MNSTSEGESDLDLEKGLVRKLNLRPVNVSDRSAATSSPTSSATATPTRTLVLSNSGKTLVVSNSSKALIVSASAKRIDQAFKKKYVKQVTGRHNDTELHLAAQRGDVAAVQDILGEINAQMTGTVSGADFDAEVAEIRSTVVNEVNDLGETPLFAAAERGHLDVVKALLPYSTREGITCKNRCGLDPLHVAASNGHHAIVQLLIEYDSGLIQTLGPSNASPLASAAARGHSAVVNELLSTDPSLIEIPRSNGKNALHLSARQGHVEIVRALLNQDPHLARRTDKKGQTALHMAVKGTSSEVVRLLLKADPAMVKLQDKFGNTALHVATRKKRVEIVQELLRLPDTHVNALTKQNKTALNIAEALPLSEETTEIRDSLIRCGALKANELNQSRDELRKNVTEIKKDVHSQLEQTLKTNQNVTGIAKELRKLHREGINNATNSVTVVAVLFATFSFAAIFTVPGGDSDRGVSVVASKMSFKIFFIANAISLFTSLAVVVVQITLVRGETKAERRVVEVINKLIWLASICTSVAFISSSHIVVGRRNRWAAYFVTGIGGAIMAGVLGAMTYYVLKSKRVRALRRRKFSSRNRSDLTRHSDTDSEVNPIYAI